MGTAPSSEHSKLEPAIDELNSRVALALLPLALSFLGAFVMVVWGAAGAG